MIETERLSLRIMVREDLDGLFGVFSDTKVLASFDLETFSREQMERWLNRNLEHQARYGYGLFSIFLRAEGTLIGDCGLEHMELGGRPEVELGYDLRSEYWNQGLATEAALAVRDYAFTALDLPRLVSLIREANDASARVAEKVGMRLDRELDLEGRPFRIFALNRQSS
jgi:[ribosomal protein S5]-alanine N-acetyltransferase